MLDLHADLRGEAMLGAVDHAAEIHALLIHHGHALLLLRDDVRLFLATHVHGQHLLETLAQAHHLEPAGIRVGRAVPVLKLGHSTSLIHDVRTRLQVQVVRVGKYRLRAGGVELFRGERFHRGLGAHGDERGGLDITVRGVDHSRATLRLAIHGPIEGVRESSVQVEGDVLALIIHGCRPYRACGQVL